jgi:putative transposase
MLILFERLKMTTTPKPLKKRYRYRIYPTAVQQEALSKVFGCVRYVYNRMLGEIKEARNIVGLITGEKYKVPSHFDMCKHLPFWKKEEDKAWLSEANSQALQASLLNLSDAYKNAFKHKKGFPKFKNKHGVQTAEYSKQMYAIVNDKLRLGKIDTHIRVKWSRLLPKEGVTSCTIIKTPSGKYYVSFIVEAQKTATTGQGFLGFICNCLITIVRD